MHLSQFITAGDVSQSKNVRGNSLLVDSSTVSRGIFISGPLNFYKYSDTLLMRTNGQLCS